MHNVHNVHNVEFSPVAESTLFLNAFEIPLTTFSGNNIGLAMMSSIG